MTKVGNLNWESIGAEFEKAMVGPAPSRAPARSTPKRNVNASVADAEIGESFVQFRLLVDPLDVAFSISDPKQGIRMKSVTLNGMPVGQIEVRFGGPGAALDSGKISFTLIGSVEPKVAEALRASSLVAVRGELGESQTLEGFLRR